MTVPGPARRTIDAPDPAATLAAARALGATLEPGDVVALDGPLGAGKTLFVRGLVEGLGGDPLDVISPSFALVARYEGRVPLVHADLYRLAAEEAACDLGLEEVAEGAVLAVEWAARAPGLLPADRIHVEIAGDGDDPRLITLEARGPLAAARLAAMARERCGAAPRDPRRRGP